MKFAARIALAVIFVLFMLPLMAHADLYYADDDGDSVQVTTQPCPPAIAKHAAEGMRGYYRLAYAKIAGNSGPACAAAVTHPQRVGPQINVLFEDGDQWLLNFDAFQSDPVKKTT